MTRRIVCCAVCVIIIYLSSVDVLSQLESSMEQSVSQEYPESAPSCLAFIFKVCQIKDDSGELLEVYELVKNKESGDKIGFVKDYINSKKELISEVKQLDPVAFKDLKQYAIIPMKRDPTGNLRFVVFCGYKKDLFLLYDPNGTLYNGIITTEDFLKQYQEKAIIIYPSKGKNIKA